MPSEMKTQDELYLTGLHLQQYRHATRHPEIYWEEALRRDPEDYRCHTAMGAFRLRRGEFVEAEYHFRRAIAALTRLNYNPAESEPFYLLGLTLRFMGDIDAAYSAFFKSIWNQAYIAAGSLALAEIDASRSNWESALDHLSRSLAYNAENLNARNLKVMILRKLDRQTEADALLRESLQLDPLDPWARHLAGDLFDLPNQQRLDLAFDYARSGFFTEAAESLRGIDKKANDGSVPICLYTLAAFLEKLSHPDAAKIREEAKIASPAYCFPSRLEEMLILEEQTKRDPRDAKAPYYLGNLQYDRRRHTEAIHNWRKSAQLDPTFSTVWRNLGIGYYNILHDESKAVRAFGKAFASNADDARVLFERDQLWKRLGRPLTRRLKELEAYPTLVERRDDLSVELATLYNQTNQSAKALQLLAARRFQPWEGGEGLAIAQYVRGHVALGRAALTKHSFDTAIEHFQSALRIPQNLGEARHVLANQSNIFYWLGVAQAGAGNRPAAKQAWQTAISQSGDFQQMAVKTFSEMTFYSALSLARLGKPQSTVKIASDLLHYARQLASQKPTIDYFATSLPTMLLFNDDLPKRQRLTVAVLRAQASLLRRKSAMAIAILKKILAEDPSHEFAFDLLEEIPFLTKPETRP